MSKILVTGGTGMLGAYVIDALKNASSDIVITTRQQIDLSNPAKISSYINEVSPQIILHFAAETDVDLCEREPSRAAIKNHLATKKIAKAAKDCNAWILYISSSNVFGKDGHYFYNELDLPNPCNYYGRSKLSGEQEVRALCPTNHLIIRSGWMIGGGPDRDHKFVGKIVQQIKNGATTLKAVNDRLGSITSASQLANFIVWAINNKPTGTMHFSSSGIISRFDVALAIGDILNFSGTIVPVQSAMFPLSAPRPFSEGIESVYLDSLGDCPLPGYWKDDLANYISTF